MVEFFRVVLSMTDALMTEASAVMFETVLSMTRVELMVDLLELLAVRLELSILERFIADAILVVLKAVLFWIVVALSRDDTTVALTRRVLVSATEVLMKLRAVAVLLKKVLSWSLDALITESVVFPPWMDELYTEL